MSPVDGPLPSDDGWCCQPKLDGHRGIVDARGMVLVRSRRGNDLTGRYPALAGLAGCGLVLDGELVVYGPDGLPAFHRVMGGSGQSGGHRFAYAVFDVLHADGNDLRGAPVEERLGLLAGSAASLGALGPVEVVPHGPPSSVWDAVVRTGLEGVVSKRTGSPYRSGRRHPDWRRTKHWTETVMDATGWTLERGRPKELAVRTPSGHATTVFHGLDERAWKALLLAAAGRVGDIDGDRVVLAEPVRVVVAHHGPSGRPRDPRFLTLSAARPSGPASPR